MSFVTNTIGLMQATALGSDSMYQWQANNQQRLGLANGEAARVANMGDQAYFGGTQSPMYQLYMKDRALTLSNIQRQVNYAAALQMQEAYQKMVKDSVKSFGTFGANA